VKNANLFIAASPVYEKSMKFCHSARFFENDQPNIFFSAFLPKYLKPPGDEY